MPKFVIERDIPGEELVREHARHGGFPANRISEVKSVIDPTTAES
jgi:hypothetical protein